MMRKDSIKKNSSRMSNKRKDSEGNASPLIPPSNLNLNLEDGLLKKAPIEYRQSNYETVTSPEAKAAKEALELRKFPDSDDPSRPRSHREV